MPTGPRCGSSHSIKHGPIPNGKPKVAGKDCRRQLVENPTWRAIGAETKALIDNRRLERISLAGLVRVTGVSGGRQTQAEWLGLYESIQRELYPYMYRVTQDWVQRHFAPLLHDDGWLRFQSVLIHDDLAQNHILYDAVQHLINGLIDFGTAGRGDPARDLGLLLNLYGETFVQRMATFDTGVQTSIDQARFYGGTHELQWVLAGVRSRSLDWFTVHLDRARDVMPYGTWLDQ